LRSFEDEIAAKMGAKECVTHELLNPYPILEEKPGEIVAHFKSTIAILPKRTLRFAYEPVDTQLYTSELKVLDEELVKLIAAPLEDKKKKEEPAKESPKKEEPKKEEPKKEEKK